MKTWKWGAVAAVVAVITAVTLSGLRAPEVTVATLKRGPVTDAVYATGEARAERRAEISPEQSGRLVEVLVEAGDTVAAGAVLARVERASLELGRAMAEQSLARARAALTEARRDRERKQALRGQNVIAVAELDSARRNEEKALADLRRLESALALEQDKLGKAEVTSPMAGLVVARAADAGEYVSAGKSLFTVIDPSTILIAVDVDETQVAKIRAGQAVTVTIDAYPGRRFEGKVARVVPLVSNLTRTAEVRIALTERPEGLTEGMSATVNVVTRTIPDAITAPRDAVTLTDDGAWLFTVKDGRLQRVEFRPGAGDDSGIEVLEGPLTAGDLVVLDPAEDLEEGMRVRVAK